MFGIGSVSKMFATIAVMQLVDRGVVDLDTPLVTYLPAFRMAAAGYENITVRMLLNHSSGFPGTDYRNASQLATNTGTGLSLLVRWSPMSWKDEYPHLYELFLASDVQHPDNYFARMDGLISLGAAQSYRDLEERFSRIDPTWRRNIIERAAPFVTRRDIETEHHWTALFETLNEVNGYVHLQELGYSEVRFIPPASHPTPDLQEVHRLATKAAFC
jgi:hypothetical protein